MASEKHNDHAHDHAAHLREKHLMLDPLPRGQMNDMVMESMRATSWKFWVVFGVLSVIVAVFLFGAWGYMIANGLGVGVMPERAFQLLSTGDALQAVALTDPWAQRQLVLVARDFSSLPASARLLVDHLRTADVRQAA